MTSSGEYTVSETARAAEISRQAYYKWLNRRLSLREQQEREVLEEIKRIEKRHQDSVGYDKMVRLLNKEGRLSYRVGIKRVSRIMKIIEFGRITGSQKRTAREQNKPIKMKTY